MEDNLKPGAENQPGLYTDVEEAIRRFGESEPVIVVAEGRSLEADVIAPGSLMTGQALDRFPQSGGRDHLRQRSSSASDRSGNSADIARDEGPIEPRSLFRVYGRHQAGGHAA